MRIFSPVYLLTTCLLFTYSFSVFGQDNELLRSRGILSKSIVGTSQQQHAYEVQKRKTRAEDISSDQYKIIDGSVELCQAIAQSGRLLINDSLSSYANKILDKLLKDDPALRKQLCVYFYYSTGTNAITLDNGMIIVELGMMAHIKNEAQLAFVLSHEICHYRENHFLKYFQFKKKEKKAGDPLSRVLSYSRELEEEADSLGFILYQSSGYSLSEATAVFDILRDSDMPEDQIYFSPVFFEHGLYHFPEDSHLDSLVEVDKKDIDETLSTHPSCDNRRERILRFLKGQDSSGNLFLVSEKAFDKLHRVAREECCSIYLEDRDYGNAIYCSYCLLTEDSTNVLAKRILGKGLYNLSAYRLGILPVTRPDHMILARDKGGDFQFDSYDTYDPVTPYSDVKGESQRLHFFLGSLNSTETTVLALDWNWKLYTAGNCKDSLLGRMCDNLMLMLCAYDKLVTTDFFPKTVSVAVSDTDTPVVDSALFFEAVKAFGFTRAEKLLEEQQQLARDHFKDGNDYEKTINPPYCLSAFDDILPDSVFVARMVKNEKAEKLPTDYFGYSSDEERKSPSGLGIQNVYILPPSYYFLNEWKRTKTYRYNGTMSRFMEKHQCLLLASDAKSTRKGYVFLTPEKLDSTSVADYNNYCLLQQWISEENEHFSNGLALNLAHAETGDSLMKRTGKRYVMTSTIISEKQKRIRHIGSYVVACIIPWTLPIAFIYGVIPRNRCMMEITLYDLHTGKTILVYQDIKKSKATVGKMQVFYASVFRKISRKQ